MTENGTDSNAWRELLARIAEAWPPARWRDVGVVVGCSGGADSVGLLTALCRLRQNEGEGAAEPPRGFLVAAHLNHGLRGEESDADEAFVRGLACQRHIEFLARRTAEIHRDEATMRNERMRFLVDAAGQSGARYVALAHSADDNVETVLHHLMRGTGPAGLAGIGSLRSLHQDLVLVRPLLNINRDLIRNALNTVGQSWRDDSSNADTHYKRNWIRHRLIPLIDSEYPHATEAMLRAIDGQRGWRTVIDRLAREWIESHRPCDQPLVLRRDRQTEQPIIVAATQTLWRQHGWPRGEMTREHWLRLATTIGSEHPERYTLPGNIDVVARDDRVEVNRLETRCDR